MLRWVSQPIADQLIQIGAHTGKYREALPACVYLFCLFGPQKRSPRSSPERALQRLPCTLSGPGQQFGDFGIFTSLLKMHGGPLPPSIQSSLYIAASRDVFWPPSNPLCEWGN